MMLYNLVEWPEFGFSTYYGQTIFIILLTLCIGWCWEQLVKKLPKEHLLNKRDDATSTVKQMMESSKKTKKCTLWILDDVITTSK